MRPGRLLLILPLLFLVAVGCSMGGAPPQTAKAPPVGYAFLSTGQVWRTTDAGRNWQDETPKAVPVGPGTALTGTAFGADDAWIAFVDAAHTGFTIEATTNGGRSWRQTTLTPQLPKSLGQSSGPDAAATQVREMTLRFLNARVGEAVTSYSLAEGSMSYDLYRTTDGGRTWSPVAVGPPAPAAGDEDAAWPDGISFASPTHVFMGFTSFILPASLLASRSCSEGAPLFESGDGGVTFARAKTVTGCPLGAALTPVFFGSAQKAGVEITGTFGAKARLSVLASADGGGIWRLVSRAKVPVSGLTLEEDASPQLAPSFAASSTSRLWLLDPLQNVIYRTSDGGLHWERSPVPRLVPADTVDLHFITPKDGWISDGSVLYVTHNGGVTFSRAAPPGSAGGMVGQKTTTGPS